MEYSMRFIRNLLRSAALVCGCTIIAMPSGAAQTIESPSANVADVSSIPIEGVAAIVNDEVISFTDVRNRAQLILLSLGVAPNQTTIRQAQQRAIDGLIDEQVQLQEANRWDVAIPDEQINQTINGIAGRSGKTIDQFLAELRDQGVNPSTLYDQIRADISWQQLVGGRYASRVRISKLQIDDKLDRITKNMGQEQYRVSEIFLPAFSEQQTAQMLQGATDLRRQIEEGAPFGLVAQQFSAAPTARSGGELGWITREQLKPELSQAIADMQPPAISPPIVTDDGVYLIALLDQRAPITPKLAGLTLKQLLATGPDARANLGEAADKTSGCRDLETASDAIDGVTAYDLGTMSLNEIGLAYQALFTSTAEGEATDILELSDNRLAKVYVCKHVMDQGAIPSRDELEESLREQQISLIADRYLRDLKRDATIIRR